MATDDKSRPPITCAELDRALDLAKTEVRAPVSCALRVLHTVWKSNDWQRSPDLRDMLYAILRMNDDAGIREGMTDDEAQVYTTMTVSLALSFMKDGGAK